MVRGGRGACGVWVSRSEGLVHMCVRKSRKVWVWNTPGLLSDQVAVRRLKVCCRSKDWPFVSVDMFGGV